MRSQDLAAKAWTGGYFAKSVVPVKDINGITILDNDEHMRPGTTAENLAGLASAFGVIGEIGGFDAVSLQKYHCREDQPRSPRRQQLGNRRRRCLVLVGSEQAGKDMGLTPRARVVATATSGADSTIMLTGPTPASKKVLAAAGLTVDDIDLFEINEHSLPSS